MYIHTVFKNIVSIMHVQCVTMLYQVITVNEHVVHSQHTCAFVFVQVVTRSVVQGTNTLKTSNNVVAYTALKIRTSTSVFTFVNICNSGKSYIKMPILILAFILYQSRSLPFEWGCFSAISNIGRCQNIAHIMCTTGTCIIRSLTNGYK